MGNAGVCTARCSARARFGTHDEHSPHLDERLDGSSRLDDVTCDKHSRRRQCAPFGGPRPNRASAECDVHVERAGRESRFSEMCAHAIDRTIGHTRCVGARRTRATSRRQASFPPARSARNGRHVPSAGNIACSKNARTPSGAYFASNIQPFSASVGNLECKKNAVFGAFGNSRSSRRPPSRCFEQSECSRRPPTGLF